MINGNISDLFFNHDLEAARLKDGKGEFDGWDDEILTNEAQFIIDCLDGLGVTAPTADELVADFKNRL